jgi:hypothetical protein
MDSLLSAKSDFSSLGSSLASLQQNAVNDQISNNAALQSYNNVKAQLTASTPSGFGDVAFGAYELLGQGKDLASRFSKVISDVKKAPQVVKDALVKAKNNLGARLEEGQDLVTNTVGDLQQTATEALQTAKDLTNTGLNATINSEGRFVTPSGRVAPPPPSERDLNQNLTEVAPQQSSQDILNSLTPEEIRMSPSDVYDRLFGTQNMPEVPVPEVPRFSLPLATKRPTTSGLADTMAPENIRQTALRAIDPEETIGPAFATNLQSFQGMPSLTGVDVPGVSSTAGDFLRGLTPESLATRPGEEILPAGQSALRTTVTGLQEEASSGLSNVLAAGRGAQQAVVTNLASTAEKSTALTSDLVTAGSGAASKASATISDLATAGTDLAKGVATDAAETVAEVSSAFLPIVGEVTAVGLGAFQIYEGFKDLFSHPSAAKPVTVPLPQIANIAQGFQSGI